MHRKAEVKSPIGHHQARPARSVQPAIVKTKSQRRLGKRKANSQENQSKGWSHGRGALDQNLKRGGEIHTLETEDTHWETGTGAASVHF